MVFTESEANIVQIYDPSVEELKPYEGAERLRNVNESIAKNIFLLEHIQLEDYGDDGIAFKVTDLLSLDTSFIEDIGELLQSYMNRPKVEVKEEKTEEIKEEKTEDYDDYDYSSEYN